MRYENPHYMAEDAGAADLIATGRLQLGISRGSPEQVIDGWRWLGYRPNEGEDDAAMARRHTEEFLKLLDGKGFCKTQSTPHVSRNPPGLLRLEPFSEGLRDRIWWGSASNATAEWAAKLGMNMQDLHYPNLTRPASRSTSSRQRRFAPSAQPGKRPATLALRASPSAAASSGVDQRSRSRVFRPRAQRSVDSIGFLDETTRAVFGRSYAAEPDVLIEQLKKDTAIAEADTLLLTVPNQLGVAYNVHVMQAILTQVAPALGWR